MNVFPTQTVYPGKVVIGSCSICGGPVLVHKNWFCTIPDVPTCGHCGATKADTHGPVIPMVPTLPRQPDISLTTDSSNTEREGTPGL
jgi:hypothetical protein